MLYISGIISREHRKLANSNNGSLDVVISELGVRSNRWVVSLYDAEKRGYYGAAFNILANIFTACVHTQRSMKFMCYAKAESVLYHIFELKDYDFVDLTERVAKWSACGSDILVVLVSGLEYQPHGVDGNIIGVYADYYGIRKICTLYEAIYELCDIAGMNLFKYKIIKIVSMDSHKETLVTIAHTPESDLFLLKARLSGRA